MVQREREKTKALTAEVAGVAPELADPLGLCTGIGTLGLAICEIYKKVRKREREREPTFTMNSQKKHA